MECTEWLNEVKNVFPSLKRKFFYVDYEKMSHKRLACVKAKIEQKINFNPESLLLGESNRIKKTRSSPKEFEVLINQDLKRLVNPALRKQIVQYLLIHEMLHIESKDLITLSKNYSRRKKRKIHVNEFEGEVFRRFNKLRELKGIMQIEKREHLDIAINKILESINWHKK